MVSGDLVLDVQELEMHFPISRMNGGGKVHAVDGVNLSIAKGEVVGLVGESGSGKSTVGKCIVRLLKPTAGRINFLGEDITTASRRKLKTMRREMQMVFQDPYSTLNPRMSIGDLVAEPLQMNGLARGSALAAKVDNTLDKVGLSKRMRHRFAHELSGGQRQRVGLARSLSVEPSLLIADEPVSALDVSVQASVMNLLMDLQSDMGFSCLFIAHDLATVELLCNRVSVMYLGQIVEEAKTRDLFESPKHPYTQSLLSAVLLPDPLLQRSRSRIVLKGDIPSPISPPSGCTFHTRCPVAVMPLCADRRPQLERAGVESHAASCHLVDADGTSPELVKSSRA